MKFFSEEELDEIMQQCDMYTKDEDGRVTFILIMGQNLNIQMDCGSGNKPLIIENLDSTDKQTFQMSKYEFLEHLKQFESDETNLIIIDDEESSNEPGQ